MLCIFNSVVSYTDSYVAENDTFAMVVPATLSFVGSLSVVLTYMLFKDLRKLRYVELLMYTSINDMLFSVGAMLGSVETGSIGCVYQGLTGNACVVSSAFWTTTITYQLYLACHGGRILRKLTFARVSSIVFPVLFAVLPLATGNSYSSNGGAYCFISREGDDSVRQRVWMVVSFYLWVFLAILIQAVLLVVIAYKLYNLGDSTRVAKIWTSFYKLVCYPLIFTLCWAVDAGADLSGMKESHNHNLSDQGAVDLVIIGTFMSMLQGFLFSLVFFSFNAIVRERWYFLGRNTLVWLYDCMGWEWEHFVSVQDDPSAPPKQEPAAGGGGGGMKQITEEERGSISSIASITDSELGLPSGSGKSDVGDIDEPGGLSAKNSPRQSLRERPSLLDTGSASFKAELEPDYLLSKAERRELSRFPPAGCSRKIGGGDTGSIHVDCIPGTNDMRNSEGAINNPVHGPAGAL
jgi:hypothetical protein